MVINSFGIGKNAVVFAIGMNIKNFYDAIDEESGYLEKGICC